MAVLTCTWAYWLEARGDWLLAREGMIGRGRWWPRTIKTIRKTLFSEPSRHRNYRPDEGFVQDEIGMMQQPVRRPRPIEDEMTILEAAAEQCIQCLDRIVVITFCLLVECEVQDNVQ